LWSQRHIATTGTRKKKRTAADETEKNLGGGKKEKPIRGPGQQRNY